MIKIPQRNLELIEKQVQMSKKLLDLLTRAAAAEFKIIYY